MVDIFRSSILIGRLTNVRGAAVRPWPAWRRLRWRAGSHAGMAV